MTDEAQRLRALAQHYLTVEQPERVLATLERPGVDLSDPTVWELRASALYLLERYNEAVRAAQQGLAQHPEGIWLLALLGSSQAELGELAAAEEALLAALRLAPESPELLCRYALLTARAGQLAKAEQLVARAAQFAPENPTVARTRGVLAYLRGDDKAMAAHSRELLAANPDDPYGHVLLGKALFNQGVAGTGARHLRTAARIDPSDRALADDARESVVMGHWLLWPLRPFWRLGTVGSWFVVVGIMVVCMAMGAPRAVFVVLVVYWLIILYSWIMPRLLRRWLYRRG